jgi:hypothetical protein
VSIFALRRRSAPACGAIAVGEMGALVGAGKSTQCLTYILACIKPCAVLSTYPMAEAHAGSIHGRCLLSTMSVSSARGVGRDVEMGGISCAFPREPINATPSHRQNKHEKPCTEYLLYAHRPWWQDHGAITQLSPTSPRCRQGASCHTVCYVTLRQLKRWAFQCQYAARNGYIYYRFV